MFEDIVDFKSPLAIENMLTPYKKGRLLNGIRQPKEPITPDVCMEILRSTNYARNIKDMLFCVAELPLEEQASFKEVILATFDNREQPNDVLILGKKLAIANAFEEEFNKTCQKKGKTLLLSSNRLARAYIAQDNILEYIDLSGYDKLLYEGKNNFKLQFMDYLPSIIEAPYCSVIGFEQVSIKGVKKIVTNENCEAYFTNLREYERDLDLSTCVAVCVGINDVDLLKTWKCARERLVFFRREYYFSDKLLDLSYFDNVQFSGCNFEKNAKILFRDGAKFKAYYVHQFPDGMDFSQFEVFETVGCNFQNQPNVKFRKGAKIDLGFAQNLPSNLDFSECAKVDLASCDLRDYDTLKLAPNVILNLSGARNLPNDIDFSQCAEVTLDECDWERQPHPYFKNARKVIAKSMGYTKVLTEASCIENCDELMLDTCDFSNFKSLKPKMGAKINFRFGRAFPADMDLSQCAEVVLEKANLKGVNGLCLTNAKKVNLQDVIEFSGVLDVSHADEVDMSWADLGNLKEAKFMDGAQVNFEFAKNVPAQIDWSKFSEVKLKYSTLSPQGDMRFRKDAKVDMSIARLPQGVIDFSLCSEVNLSEANVHPNTQFVFKNRVQMENSRLVLPKKWIGKICFKDNPDDVIEDRQDNSFSGFFRKLFANGGR